MPTLLNVALTFWRQHSVVWTIRCLPAHCKSCSSWDPTLGSSSCETPEGGQAASLPVSPVWPRHPSHLCQSSNRDAPVEGAQPHPATAGSVSEEVPQNKENKENKAQGAQRARGGRVKVLSLKGWCWAGGELLKCCSKVLLGLPVAVTQEGRGRSSPCRKYSWFGLDWDVEKQLQASRKQGKITRNKIISDGHEDMK